MPGMRAVLLVILSYQFVHSSMFEGEECNLENGAQGVCKKLPDCPSRLMEVLQGKRNSGSAGRCGFENFTEIVCCPVNLTQKSLLRPAEIACQEYDNKVTPDDEQQLQFHIFGGFEAQHGEFPYAVALGYRNNKPGEDAPAIEYSCGGSLISSEHVLTAAHCVNNLGKRVLIEVRLGNIDLNSTAENVQRIAISDIISHPRYRRSKYYNDVAIVKLKTKVQMSSTARPICLQTKSLDSIRVTPRASFVVIGWGATSDDVEGSNRLMRTPNLSIVDNAECRESFPPDRKLPQGIDDSLICAIGTNITSMPDACLGDSGGPLLMLSESGDTVVGITAFGRGCGTSTPGIYTAVHSYLDWIEEQVWPSPDNVVKKTFLKINITGWINER